VGEVDSEDGGRSRNSGAASGATASVPEAAGSSFATPPPSLALPKGGGAIRGIGEKFTANAVTGTGAMTVPIATSPGRSGFGPQLSLAYDSGVGNSVFGLGWQLSPPAITRKTDKGLPQYRHLPDSDVFILSGVEDLVPVKLPDGTLFEDRLAAPGYIIHRYRPRIEGQFARIERWTRVGDPANVHWRSYSRENILSLYGKDAGSRITDPDNAQQIFSWLICEVRDDKGNAVLYTYKHEDASQVDLTRACEANRGDALSSQRTVNRYLKRIQYGNRMSLLANDGSRPQWLTAAQIAGAGWMFEVVFDYGEHDAANPKPGDAGDWLCRRDPFSTRRAGFEIRTYRLCRRALMFHHFPDEPEVRANCLVRSTSFEYRETPAAAFLVSVTQSAYRRLAAGGYLARSMPRLEFEYSEAVVGNDITEVDAQSTENLPAGAGGPPYRWVDLDGEGLSGLLCEQSRGWFYKRNESPRNREGLARTWPARFAPQERVASLPNVSALSDSRVEFLDLAGDGQVDVVELEAPLRGFYERTDRNGWQPLRAFSAVPNVAWQDPNLRFIDLTGDGHADILITSEEAFTWYASLAEEGFDEAQRMTIPTDEELGPRIVFADANESIFLSDMSGDGLTDIVRLRNSEACYWPNLGYGRFGRRIAMDGAPHFDSSEDFDARRIRLADVDGSGTTDLLYLGRNVARFWFNEAGNGWSPANELTALPPIDNVASVAATDVLGNGTAALVWSSPLPRAAEAPMKVLSLMAEGKPHLLTTIRNNLGAETRIEYAPSTYFYLKDRVEGQPWVTRLPFPVHVVERTEIYDHVSRNRFVTRYSYHHGYFDGQEREFRGFARVDQIDTEELGALKPDGSFPAGDNFDAASYVPPVLTRTWFHTGHYVGRDRVSNYFAGLIDAGDRGEYYREPGLTDAQARELLLDDTVLPFDLTLPEEREACRALKGSMLRQEVYALDGTPQAAHPYIVTEQNFSVRLLQAQGDNRHAVFLVHPREALTYHYERDPADPRISHVLTLEVDPFGAILKEAAVSYGRRLPDPVALPLAADRDQQTRLFVTYSESEVTNAIDDATDYRPPLPCETFSFELTGYTPSGAAGRFRHADFVKPDLLNPPRLAHVFDSEIPYEAAPALGRQRRKVEHLRTLYRPNDMGGSLGSADRLLPLGKAASLALAGESFKLAFTPGLLQQLFTRDGLALLPANPGAVLAGTGPDRGGYVDSHDLKLTATFPATDVDGTWWIPSGRVFHSPLSTDTPAQELSHAHTHFFLGHRHRNSFAQTTTLLFDAHDLLMIESQDPLGNRVTVGERLPGGALDATKPGNDYRVLLPWRVMDANRNRTEVRFDVFGMVVGTASLGKPEESLGDSLVGFDPDLSEPVALAHLANPLLNPQLLLGNATSRLIYDPFAYERTRNDPQPQSVVVCTLSRDTHVSDALPASAVKLHHAFAYSDGFGREIQRKVQAEPGPVPARAPGGAIILGPDGQPQMTLNDVSPRWIGSGWTVFNNKGKTVRQFEPFFSDTQHFEFDVRVGVSPIQFYDPMLRVVATLQPNHTWTKALFDPWRQESWDVTDTLTIPDPSMDADVGPSFARLNLVSFLPTWLTLRQGGGLGADEQTAALKAALLANTPTIAHLDSLGRTFLTVAHNKAKYSDTPPAAPPVETFTRSRVVRDIEGNTRAITDAQDRLILTCEYNLLGARAHHSSMEAGKRWVLLDVANMPLRIWDSRGHEQRSEYDALRRPTAVILREGPGARLVVSRTVYGEAQPAPEARNLRGRPVRTFDQAGIVTNDEYDFKGNLLGSRRQFAQDFKGTLDWSAAVPMNPQIYTTRTRYDALNRVVQATAPHDGSVGASINVVQSVFNERRLLAQVHVWLGQNSQPSVLLNPVSADQHAVTRIDYDARGQRMRIDYGNDTSTTYDYDPLTSRLVHMVTRRDAVLFPDDCPKPPPAGWPGCQLQNLSYIHDPAGNIMAVRDDAQQTRYFQNRRVEPSTDYTYDALARLIEATGRQHLGQAGAPIPHSYNDAPRMGLPQPGDGNAMGRYLERYLYDLDGNILQMKHLGTDPAHPGFHRDYVYDEVSLLEPAARSNRLTRTSVGATSDTYSTGGNGYDAHGNLLRMPQLQATQWDYMDQLRMTQRQAVNADDAEGRLRQAERTWYVYDSSGTRTRKVTESATGQLKEERLYLNGLEIYVRNGASPLTRETLHVTDGKRRIALVETRTRGSEAATPKQLIRYQIENHLGSATLELDGHASIISYEEYTPFGSSSYQAVRSTLETPKRYRATGKERDEETGFGYHRARYYAPWLGRWISCDPASLVDGANLYAYARCNPVSLVDPSGLQSMPQAKYEEFKHWVNRAAEVVKPIEKKIDAAEAKVKETASDAADATGAFFKKQAEDIVIGTVVAGMIYKSKDPKAIAAYEEYGRKKDMALIAGMLEGATMTQPANAPSSKDKPIPAPSEAKLITHFVLTVGPFLGPSKAALPLAGELPAARLELQALEPAGAELRISTANGKPVVSMPELTIEMDTAPSAAARPAERIDLPDAPGSKTVSGSGIPGMPTYRSGWGRQSQLGDFNASVENWRYNQQSGTPFDPHFRDMRGAPGSYNASHSEAQQLFVEPGVDFMEITKPSCCSCSSRLSLSAQLWDMPIVTLTPDGFRWYLPTGTFW
jgi:RHS repeat-associated protein